MDIIIDIIITKQRPVPKSFNGFNNKTLKILKTEYPDFFICKLLPTIVQKSIIKIAINAAFFRIILKRAVFSTAKTVIGITRMSIKIIDINADIIIKNVISNNDEFLCNNTFSLFFIVGITFFNCSHFNKRFFRNSANSGVLIMIHFEP